MSTENQNKLRYLRHVDRMKASAESDDPNHTFLSALSDMYDEADERIAAHSQDDVFGQAALVRFLTQELLRYAIEDEGIDVRDEAPRVAEAFSRYFQTSDQTALMSAYESIVRKTPIEVRKVLMRAPDHGICVYASMPVASDQLIPVSTSTYPIVPVLEETLADPQFCGDLVSVYASTIEQIRSHVHIDRLCFIEKAVGPVGALGLLSSLVDQTCLPAFVYRQRYFTDRGRVSGSRPSQGDSVVLIYDLVVSGHGLKQAAENLERKFQVKVVGAVVLLNYTGTTVIKTNYSFPVHTIIQYDSIKSEVQNIHSGVIQYSKNVSLLHGRRDLSAPPAQKDRASSDRNGGTEKMSDERLSDEEGFAALERLRVERGWTGRGVVPDGMTLEEWVTANGLTEADVSPEIKPLLTNPKAARKHLKKIGIL